MPNLAQQLISKAIHTASPILEYAIPKKSGMSVQETLPFLDIARDGLIWVGGNRYSIGIGFGDTEYHLAQDDIRAGIHEHWCTLLNGLDETISFDLLCIVRPASSMTKSATLCDINLFEGSKLFDVAQEYSQMMQMRMAKADGGFIREHFLTLSIEAKDVIEARQRLDTASAKVLSRLNNIGVPAHVLNGTERMELLANCLQQFDVSVADKWNDIEAGSINARDLISPQTIRFDDPEHFFLEDTHFCACRLELSAPEISDDILYELMDSNLPLFLSFHIKPMNHTKAMKLIAAKRRDILGIKAEEQKKALQAGYDPDILPAKLEDLELQTAKLHDIMRDSREELFEVCLTFLLQGKSQEDLDAAYFTINTVAQQQSCELKKLAFMQEQAFCSVLPVGNYQLPFNRLLTTTSTGVFIPFTAAELNQGADALFYGVNTVTRNPIRANRTELTNPNGLILGIPGGGKSYSAKSEMLGVYLSTYGLPHEPDIIICDPEGEYGPLVDALGGQIIKISANSAHHLNLMDISLDYSEDDDPLILKSDFILSFIEVLMNSRFGLEPIEKTVIDRCLPRVYRAYFNDPKPENMPILEDLYNELQKEPEEAAQRIATALEIYVYGSLRIFNHRSNVDINSRVVCFDIKGLGKQLKKLGMLIVQDQVWNRVTANRQSGRFTYYYVDEFHLMLKEEQTSAYMVEIWKRFRKWGGVPTGITQNVKDFLASPEIENIVENSNFVLLLSQAAGDKHILAQMLNISEQQLAYVTNVSPGEGLIVYGSTIVPFENRYDTKGKLHALLTTKFAEK